MNSGGKLVVDMHTTAAGFQVVITNHTTSQAGSMTASIANGFGHPLYQPSAATCSDQAYAFHPMYSMSSPDTRVLWAAHSYNVAYSDAVGHFEYCNNGALDANGTCTAASPTDLSGPDGDEHPCFINAGNATVSRRQGQDLDCDGPDYGRDWPGSTTPASADQSIHAAPVTFTSPLFTGPGNSGLWNYQHAAFENNLPRVEGFTNPPCQRHAFNPSDPSPGAGCVDPPVGARFYPIYSTVSVNGACVWAEGDAHLPGTISNFGGTPTAEYGGFVVSVYPRSPTAAGTTQGIIEVFHTTLTNNPCLTEKGVRPPHAPPWHRPWAGVWGREPVLLSRWWAPAFQRQLAARGALRSTGSRDRPGTPRRTVTGAGRAGGESRRRLGRGTEHPWGFSPRGVSGKPLCWLVWLVRLAAVRHLAAAFFALHGV